MIQNNGKDINIWLPYMYVGGRRTTHLVRWEERCKTNRFTWTAEIFIPYELIATFNNAVRRRKGTQWRANFTHRL